MGGPHQDLTEERLRQLLAVNIYGPLRLTQLVLPGMLQQGSGHIVNVGSMVGIIHSPGLAAYTATRAAVRAFSEALRREVGVWGIRVSVIYPGAVRTEFSQQAGIKRKTGMTTPAFLMLEPQEVAQVVLKVVRHPRRMVILPPVMRVAVWLNAAFPGCVDRVIAQRFVKPERL